MVQLVKWRHWDSRVKEVGPINQKVLENHLRRKWAERLLAHLIPHAAVIPHLAPLRGDNEAQEFHDLLGDTRFRTLRQCCLVLEQMIKWGLPIPWGGPHQGPSEQPAKPRSYPTQTSTLLGHLAMVLEEVWHAGGTGRTPSPSEETNG